MKLEAGKTYITRDGRKVRVLCTDAKHTLPVMALLEFDNKESFVAYRLDGGWTGFDTESDIVGPWVEKPVFDRSMLPPWCNKAIAMDDCGDWCAFDVVPEILNDTWMGQDYVVHIPAAYAPKWEGGWKDSLLVWEGEQ